MPTISLIVNGVERPVSGYGALVSHSGWGAPPMDTISSRAPGQHGDTWVDRTLAPRLGTFTIKLNKTDLDEMYDIRNTLLDELVQYPVLVKFVSGTRTRVFSCQYYDGLSMDWAVGNWAAQNVNMVFKASTPTCYDPTIVGLEFSLGTGSSPWPVPWRVPWTLGAVSIHQTQSVVYLGNWVSYPMVTIKGPITDPIVTSANSGFLSFPGITIPEGETYTINCEFAAKTVVNSAGVNKLSELSADSNLGAFCVASGLPGGINVFSVDGSVINSATQIYLSYYNRYLGV